MKLKIKKELENKKIKKTDAISYPSWDSITSENKSFVNKKYIVKKPNVFQVLTYIFIIINWLLLIFWFKNLTIIIILLLFAIINLVIIIILGIILSFRNPNSYKFNKIQNIKENNGSIFYCGICNKLNKNRKTYHCKKCKMCIKGIDHHCIWFNNCININNYKYFIIILFSSWTFNSIILYLGVYNIIYIKKDTFRFILSIIDIILNTVLILFLWELIIFHLYLIYKKLSTIEYIKKKSKLNNF